MEDCDGMKSSIKATVQEVPKAEMAEFPKAGPHERHESRQGDRAGYYERSPMTRIRKLGPRVPPRPQRPGSDRPL
jgi:putative transposase